MNRTLVLAPLAGIAAGAATFALVSAGLGHGASATTASRQQSVPAASAPAAIEAAAMRPSTSRTVTAYLTADAHNVLHYRTATWLPGGLDNGHYVVGHLTRTVPLADRPVIRSAVNICSNGQVTMDRHGNPTKSCTTKQLAASLKAGYRPYATLDIENGRVVKVLERYVP